MRKQTLKITAGLILLIQLAIPGFSGDASGDSGQTDKSHPLSLETAVAIALDHNPRVRAAIEGITAAEEARGEARAPFYPELGLIAGYSRWERHAFLPKGLARPDIPRIIGPTDDWSAGLRSRYTIFDSGKRRAELQAALARIGAAENEADGIRQDIVLLVHQAYFGLAAAQEFEVVARKKLARAEDHARLSVERKEAGAVPQADVVRAQVDIADAKLALERFVSEARIARGNLNTAMGLPAETPVAIDGKPHDITPPSALQIHDAIELAISLRPELKAARQRVEAAKKGIAAARSAFGPKVQAEGSFGWRDADFLPHDKDWMAGFSIELPIFTGFSRAHRLGKIKAEFAREEADLDALTLAIRQEVWAAHSRLHEAFERVRATEPMVRDAQESVRLAQERYEAGAGTMTDLLDSETSLAKAEAIQAEAAWDFQTAKSVFQRAMGLFNR